MGGCASTRVRARPVVPGTRYLVTRRCTDRRYFLTPDAKNAERINNFIGYVLGVCLERYGIELHAMVVMSTHLHDCITDLLGHLPAFKTTLHAWIARGINALRGRFDRFWSSDQPLDVRPGDPMFDDEGEELPRSALDDLVYTLTNPVKDGAVRNGARWPGFTTYGWRFGEARTFKRPSWFFDPDNPDLPDEVSITLKRPVDVMPELADDQLYDLLMSRVREREVMIQSERRRSNRRFMGERKVQKQRWDRQAHSHEDRFTVGKGVRDREPRRVRAALARDRAWRLLYAEARRRMHEGERGVEFPYGTYWMARFAGVKVALAPP